MFPPRRNCCPRHYCKFERACWCGWPTSARLTESRFITYSNSRKIADVAALRNHHATPESRARSKKNVCKDSSTETVLAEVFTKTDWLHLGPRVGRVDGNILLDIEGARSMVSQWSIRVLFVPSSLRFLVNVRRRRFSMKYWRRKQVAS